MKPYIHTIFLLMVFICIGYADALQKPLADINAKVNKSNITRSVEVINITPTLSSLSLESNATTVNKAETVQLSVVGTYSDNSANIVDENITYIISPVENTEVNGSVLTALKDGSVTVQAKVGTTLSNTLNLTITWIVDGHTLPPEPDPVENDTTLGGVDSNNNGVRDDVERKIYEKYPVKLHRALLMDGAKFYQRTLVEPISNAKNIVNESTQQGNCELYLMNIDTSIYSNEWREQDKYINYISINTKERVRKYLDYNLALSGGVYGGSPKDWNREACSPEVIKALEEKGL